MERMTYCGGGDDTKDLYGTCYGVYCAYNDVKGGELGLSICAGHTNVGPIASYAKNR